MRHTRLKHIPVCEAWGRWQKGTLILKRQRGKKCPPKKSIRYIAQISKSTAVHWALHVNKEHKIFRKTSQWTFDLRIGKNFHSMKAMEEMIKKIINIFSYLNNLNVKKIKRQIRNYKEFDAKRERLILFHEEYTGISKKFTKTTEENGRNVKKQCSQGQIQNTTNVWKTLQCHG